MRKSRACQRRAEISKYFTNWLKIEYLVREPHQLSYSLTRTQKQTQHTLTYASLVSYVPTSSDEPLRASIGSPLSFYFAVRCLCSLLLFNGCVTQALDNFFYVFQMWELFGFFILLSTLNEKNLRKKIGKQPILNSAVTPLSQFK